METSVPLTGSATESEDSVRERRIPPKLLEDAAQRLGWLAPTAVILIVFIQLFQHLAQPQAAEVLADQNNRLATLAAVLLGLGVFALQHYKLVTASTILVLGMVFEIAVAACVSMIETTQPVAADGPVLGISAMGPWLIVVGAFIPNRPIWTLVTAATAATTWPVCYAINASLHDFPRAPWGALIVWPFFNYLMAVLAYLIGRRMYGMTIAAQRARDLGSYRLVSRIGDGGMGEVWKATHQMLAREAAIKLVKPEVMSQSSARQADLAVKRFRREANAIAGLQSPHTVYLYDFGVSQDGRFYYVMELLDGISLQTLVTSFGPQAASRVVTILRQICRSLEEAHAQGLVHRDLKPSNVMLCKVALTHDFIKVLDFGLAKSVARDDVTQLTMEGLATGTPGYIAPEVAMGEVRIDERADVYALGCVAYFLLTGTLVFHDTNPVSMALKHVQATPDPPSQRTELPIPRDLERLVLKCLEKKPSARPATAREIAEVLALCEIPEWTDDDANAWWERHLPPTSSLRTFTETPMNTPPTVLKA